MKYDPDPQDPTFQQESGTLMIIVSRQYEPSVIGSILSLGKGELEEVSQRS